MCARSSEELAVKEYVRSAAGCDLSREEWLRPPKVLLATVDYLIRYCDLILHFNIADW